MAKAQAVKKQLKPSLKGKIMKRKIIKPKADEKKKIKKVAKTELPLKRVELLTVEIKERKPKPRPVFRMSLRSRPYVEKTKNYVSKSKLDHDQTRRGVTALYELLKKKSTKPELFDEEQPLFLQVTCIKVPNTPIRHLRFNVEHTFVTDSSEICLIVADKGKRQDHESTIEHYENILSKKGITNIKTIMPFHQFRHEYGAQYELKRKLLHLYDHFLVDARVSGYVKHLLGSIFYESRKMPTTVKIHENNLKEHFERALKKTIMKIHSKGDSYAVQIGHTGMSAEEVSENVIGIAKELNDLFPGGFHNVRALGVKSNDSLCIPIYLTLKKQYKVKVPICKPVLPKSYKPITDTLSTYLNADVTVQPDGEVILTKLKPTRSVRVPKHLESMNEDEVEIEVAEDNEGEEKVESKDEEKDAKTADTDESDEEDDDLAKEEEMYLHNYEHEQEQEEEQSEKKKSKSAKQKKPSKD